MFRKYNKKIFTVIVMVIVSIGLIGPGAILIFAEVFGPQQERPVPQSLSDTELSQDEPVEEAVVVEEATQEETKEEVKYLTEIDELGEVEPGVATTSIGATDL